jgi:hypothetical protein
MKKKWISTTRKVLLYSFCAISIIAGFLLYRVFLTYVPGADLDYIFLNRTGMPAFRFIGISAGVLISLPLLVVAFSVYEAIATSYIRVTCEKGTVLLSDTAIASFIHDTVSQISGVDSVEVRVNLLKEKSIGISIWLDIDEKNDFIRFSERIQQRVLQDLEFNFGLTKVKYFNVFLESTDINSGSGNYKVNYK